MKTVELRGGLGNQLFGLAFAHSVRCLAGEAAVAAPANRAPSTGFDIAPLAAALGLQVQDFTRRVSVSTRCVHEGAPPKNASELHWLIDSGTRFRGYWQHPAYFAQLEAVRAIVRAHLRAWCGPAPEREVVIHFRAYADEPIPWRRGTPPPDYFARALAAAPVATRPTLVSDQPQLAVRRLGAIGRRAEALEGSAADHLAHLLAARALILANSSFSWWAGFCGGASTVIYPRRYRCFHYPKPAPEFALM